MYSVAPGGGFTTTGVGDDGGAATIGTVGAAVVADADGFGGGV
jgi:hypothetical protein